MFQCVMTKMSGGILQIQLSAYTNKSDLPNELWNPLAFPSWAYHEDFAREMLWWCMEIYLQHETFSDFFTHLLPDGKPNFADQPFFYLDLYCADS